MKRLAWLCVGLLPVTGGCPSQPQGGDDSAVTAHIAISSTTGSQPPLRVTVSAAESSSRNGGPLQYSWDFADEAAADTETASHTFESPGLHTVVLRVTDSAGETGVGSVDVRIQGSPPTAVIQADTNSGPVTLIVNFDGTGSFAQDDVIRDYAWDFGDGSAIDRTTRPTHPFDQAGEYTVTLTVTTAGGAEGSTTTVISAGARNGSLQFDGSQFATLPLAQQQTLTGCTFEAWFKAGTGGGTLVSIGDGALAIDIQPGENSIRFQVAGQSYTAAAASLSGLWRHVALTYAADGVTIYLDSVALQSAAGGEGLNVSQLTVGMGFVGKIADVRFWSVARQGTDIAANYRRRLSTMPDELLGYWRLDDGSGQTLDNRAGSRVPGTRGGSTAEEVTDPAWSTDGPNL